MKIGSFLKKLLAATPAGEAGEDTGVMGTRVSEVYRLHGMASAVVPDDSPLESIVIKFADEPGLWGIFLVSSQRRFTGVVTRIDLLRWAHFQLFGSKGRRKMTVSEFFRLVDAKKAKDLCRGDQQALSVKESDSLQAALDKMLDQEEDVLPVLDSQGEIIDDLRLSEVLQWLLVHGRRKLEGRE